MVVDEILGAEEAKKAVKDAIVSAAQPTTTSDLTGSAFSPS